MTNRSRPIRWVILVSFVLAGSASLSAAPVYILDDLGANTSAAGINNSGQVAGSFVTSTGNTHAFLWERGILRDLGTLGGSRSSAVAINEAGHVIGTSLTATGEQHAFYWNGDSMLDMGTLGGALSIPYDINNLGQVVGYSTTATGVQHAFLYAAGTMIDLDPFGGSLSGASAINDAGQIIGTARDQSNTTHRLLWNGGTVTDLSAVGFASVTGINAGGQVIGTMSTPSGTHAALWKGTGTIIDLGTFPGGTSSAVAINSAGQVLGVATRFVTPSIAVPLPFLYNGAGISSLVPTNPVRIGHAEPIDLNELGQAVGTYGNHYDSFFPLRTFIYRDGVFYDIAEILGGATGWNFGRNSRLDINDLGQVAGNASYFAPGPSLGVPHAFVASTPAVWEAQRGFPSRVVPEPAALLSLASGLTLVLAWRRYRGRP